MSQPRSFGYGEEQEMIKDAARRFVANKSPLTHLRTQIEGTEDPYHGRDRAACYDEAAWKEMIDLGWQSLAVPEAQGGSGMDLVTAVALAEEIGRAAMPSPLTSTLQSTFVLRQAASEGANSLLAGIANGASVTLAITGDRIAEYLPLISRLYGRKITAEILGRLSGLSLLEGEVQLAIHEGRVSPGDLLQLGAHPGIDTAAAARLNSAAIDSGGTAVFSITTMRWPANPSGRIWAWDA